MDTKSDNKVTMDTACGYHVGYDYVTDTPLHYLSLILKYAIPKDFVWDQALKKIIETDSFYDVHYGERDVQFKETRFAGSTSEGLAVPDYQYGSGLVKADIDKLIIHPNWYYFDLPYEHRELSSVQILRIENAKDSPPNYDFLVPTEEFKRNRALIGQPIVETKYFSNMALKEDQMAVWTDTYKRTQKILPGKQLIGNYHRNMLENIRVHGPAVTLEEPIMGDRDEVPVVPFAGFPPVARDWVMRKRVTGWPSKRVINRVVVSGFYMAGVGRRGTEMCDYEWRYSFNLAEKILAHSFNKCQRQLYIYLKLLRKFYLKEPAIFPSYWIKTFFFWTCEKIPESQFGSENLGQMMFYLLDELIHIFGTGYLKNYFISGINWLENVPRDHLMTLVKNLRYVKANLIQCILNIDSQIQFLNLGRMYHQKLNVLFCECLDNLRKCPHDVEQFKTSAKQGLKKVLGHYLFKIQQLDRLDDDLALEKEVHRKFMVELVREVLADLHKLCKYDTSQDETDIMHIMEQNTDASVIGRVLVFLRIQGSKDKFARAQRNLCVLLDTKLSGLKQEDDESNEDKAKNLLEDVRKYIENFPLKLLENLDNEKLYRITSVMDTASLGLPYKQDLQHACKTM